MLNGGGRFIRPDAEKRRDYRFFIDAPPPEFAAASPVTSPLISRLSKLGRKSPPDTRDIAIDIERPQARERVQAMSRWVMRVKEIRKCKDGMTTLRSVALTGIAAVALAGTFQWKWAILAWFRSCFLVALKIPL